MLMEELLQRFIVEKNRNPLHDNELLDYLQKSYIFDELTIVEYKQLFHELNQGEAEKPTSYFIKTFDQLKNVDIPV